MQGSQKNASEEKLDALRQKLHEYDFGFSIDCVVKDVQQFMAFATKKTEGTKKAIPLILVDGTGATVDSQALKRLEI